MVSALTHINSANILDNLEWKDSGSPYIIDESIYIPDKYKLNIDSGVKIESLKNDENDRVAITVDGGININGSKDNEVLFKDLGEINLVSNNSVIKYAVFDNSELILEKSTTTITNSIIKNSKNAIISRGSNLKIDNSTINNNINGIKSEYEGQVFQVKNNIKSEIGGIGNAVIMAREDGQYDLDIYQNIINISNSNLFDNQNYAIDNSSTNPVFAEDNWWGNAKGPNTQDTIKNDQFGDIILGDVIYSPWKDNIVSPDICCSNIIFIPGIQATRLYKDDKGVLGTSTNMLWEPNREKDIDILSMNVKGQSINSGIYAKDIIDKAYGVKSIYSNLIDYLNHIVENKNINSWKSIPYDWRYNVFSLIDNNVINSVYSMASTSKTGKVTIISHSNGGLFTKALIKKLNDKGRGDTIDKIIFVAVPDLGTPQALLGMLHGYGQSILGGIFLTENKSRKFSQNLPGAYGLLPSLKIFDNNKDIKIIDSYSSATSSKVLSGYTQIKDFLIGNSFSLKNTDDINIPLLLNKTLLTESENLHNTLDNLLISSSTKIVNIKGWGNITTQGIEYQREPHCFVLKCPIEFNPIFTNDGDGTVINMSDFINGSNTEYLNLKKLKTAKKLSINHSNIFNSDELIEKINSLVTVNNQIANTYDSYFSATKPVDDTKYLSVKVHSPVSIDAYDEDGNHTGRAVDNLSISNDINKYDTDIPDSYYEEYGRVKMLILPYDGMQYKIKLKGLDTAPFSVDARVIQNDNTITSINFSDMPITTNSIAEIELATSTIDFASSSQIKIDIDGNNTIDFINKSDDLISESKLGPISDLSTYIATLKKILFSIRVNEDKRVNSLLMKISRLETKLRKNGYKPDNTMITTNIKIKEIKLNNSEFTKTITGIEKMIKDIEIQNK